MRSRNVIMRQHKAERGMGFGSSIKTSLPSASAARVHVSVCVCVCAVRLLCKCAVVHIGSVFRSPTCGSVHRGEKHANWGPAALRTSERKVRSDQLNPQGEHR